MTETGPSVEGAAQPTRGSRLGTAGTEGCSATLSSHLLPVAFLTNPPRSRGQGSPPVQSTQARSLLAMEQEEEGWRVVSIKMANLSEGARNISGIPAA